MLRRLQLAAEDQGCWVLLFRPASASQQRSPAALRILLSQASSQAPTATRVQILKCRGGRPGVVDVEGLGNCSCVALPRASMPASRSMPTASPRGPVASER